MSTYYNYYLERKEADGKWSTVLPEETDPYTLKLSFYYTSGIGQVFFDEYSGWQIGFEYCSEEYKKEYQKQYENESDPFRNYYYPYEMDLERIIMDYNNQLHEYAGIISRNSYKRLQSDPEYDPKIIDEETYAAFKDDVKENYLYHEWDTIYDSCYYLYQIVPLINDLIRKNDLDYQGVRLLCTVG